MDSLLCLITIALCYMAGMQCLQAIACVCLQRAWHFQNAAGQWPNDPRAPAKEVVQEWQVDMPKNVFREEPVASKNPFTAQRQGRAL